MNFLFTPPSSDDFIHLLKAWKFWLLGAVIGAVIGAAVYYLALPPYRARASVNVDFHLEQAWPQNTDREQFYYLDRETRKLEEIAMSDAVLNKVAAQVSGVSVDQMRNGKLQLSQPAVGGWHFFADDKDPKKADALASAWAQAFADQVKTEVVAASTSGLEPYITVNADQTQNIPTKRLFSVSTYLFAGAIAFLMLSALIVLFFHPNPVSSKSK
jgi:capsular polysaccharide biosynthesis protein